MRRILLKRVRRLRISSGKISLLLFALSIATAVPAIAQDRIHTTSGNIIPCKVKSVSIFWVRYYRPGEDSHSRSIDGKKVERVIYADGSRWSPRPKHIQAKRDDKAQKPKPLKSAPQMPFAVSTCGRNIISLAPIVVNSSESWSLPPNGLGMHYERFLDEKRSISFTLPLSVSFFMMDYMHGVEGYAPEKIKEALFTQLNPGVKYYPFGSNHRATYSFGPALGIGWGNRFNYLRDAQGKHIDTLLNEKYSNLAFLINNALYVWPHRSFFFGVELNVGISFEKAAIELGFEQFTYKEPFAQFLFEFGFRF
jgi:hypothetical protein